MARKRAQHAAKARPTDTVAALVKEYVAKHVRITQRGLKEEERVLNVDVLPSRKDRSVKGVGALRNYRLRAFSIRRLMTLVTALGHDVEIVIRRKPRLRRAAAR